MQDSRVGLWELPTPVKSYGRGVGIGMCPQQSWLYKPEGLGQPFFQPAIHKFHSSISFHWAVKDHLFSQAVWASLGLHKSQVVAGG